MEQQFANFAKKMIHIDNLQKILSGRTICKIVVQNNNLLNKLF